MVKAKHSLNEIRAPTTFGVMLKNEKQRTAVVANNTNRRNVSLKIARFSVAREQKAKFSKT